MFWLDEEIGNSFEEAITKFEDIIRENITRGLIIVFITFLL